jgi:hypothetical protein
MINYDVLYASQQRFADLIADANTRPVERTMSRPSVFDRALSALQSAFAKPQPQQTPAIHNGFASQ